MNHSEPNRTPAQFGVSQTADTTPIADQIPGAQHMAINIDETPPVGVPDAPAPARLDAVLNVATPDTLRISFAGGNAAYTTPDPLGLYLAIQEWQAGLGDGGELRLNDTEALVGILKQWGRFDSPAIPDVKPSFTQAVALMHEITKWCAALGKEFAATPN